VLRLRRATFLALCPDPPEALLAWLSGSQPEAGASGTVVLLDPTVPFGSRRQTIAAPIEATRIEPRHQGYGDAARALRIRS